MIEYIPSTKLSFWNSKTNTEDPEDIVQHDLPEFIYVTDVLNLQGTPPDQVPELIEDFINYALLFGFKKLKITYGKSRSIVKYSTLKVLEQNLHVMNFFDEAADLEGYEETIIQLK